MLLFTVTGNVNKPGTSVQNNETDALTHTLSASSRKPRRAQVKVEYELENGAAVKKGPHWEPTNWMQQLANIREMRSARDAPVDQMGAAKCFDTHVAPKVSRQKIPVKAVADEASSIKTNDCKT